MQKRIRSTTYCTESEYGALDVVVLHSLAQNSPDDKQKMPKNAVVLKVVSVNVIPRHGQRMTGRGCRVTSRRPGFTNVALQHSPRSTVSSPCYRVSPRSLGCRCRLRPARGVSAQLLHLQTEDRCSHRPSGLRVDDETIPRRPEGRGYMCPLHQGRSSWCKHSDESGQQSRSVPQLLQ